MNMHVTPKKKRSVRTPHIELRIAVAADAAAIAVFLGRFFALSCWAQHLKYDETRARIYLEHALGSKYAVYVIALDAGELAGLCSYHAFDVFTDPMAVMDETYTDPKYRFTDLGRRLVGLAIEMARADGCKVMNFPICSGLPSQNSLMNMVGRHFGAEPVGMIFRKVL